MLFYGFLLIDDACLNKEIIEYLFWCLFHSCSDVLLIAIDMEITMKIKCWTNGYSILVFYQFIHSYNRPVIRGRHNS